MNRDQFLRYHSDMCVKMHDIVKAKNDDYTGTSDYAFANFIKVEMHGICTAEQGFLVRMNDKFSRIVSFVQKGVLLVKDESVEDTLIDFANYCILLAAFIKSKRVN